METRVFVMKALAYRVTYLVRYVYIIFIMPFFVAGIGLASSGPAGANPTECIAGKTTFTLTSAGGEFVWHGIRLSISHFAASTLRNGIQYARLPFEERPLRMGSLSIRELQTRSTEDTPSLVSKGALRLSSNVTGFKRTVPIAFGGVDIADLSFCQAQQINLHCGDISYLAAENAAALKCSLVIFDPSDIVTP